MLSDLRGHRATIRDDSGIAPIVRSTSRPNQGQLRYLRRREPAAHRIQLDLCAVGPHLSCGFQIAQWRRCVPPPRTEFLKLASDEPPEHIPAYPRAVHD